MKRIIDDVEIKCLTCGANMKEDYKSKVGLCSMNIYYKCLNCGGWIARKDIFDKYLLNVHFEKIEYDD